MFKAIKEFFFGKSDKIPPVENTPNLGETEYSPVINPVIMPVITPFDEVKVNANEPVSLSNIVEKKKTAAKKKAPAKKEVKPSVGKKRGRKPKVKE